MRNKFLMSILPICALILAAGCGSGTAKEDESVDAAKVVDSSVHNQEDIKEREDTDVGEGTKERDYYGELIAAARECIQGNTGEMPENFDFSSVMITSGDDETLGYLIEDIDGNGTEELIFGGNRAEPDAVWDGIVYDIYTVSGGELVHVLDGWERNRYYLCENGMIANEGSSGAANSNYSYFTFEGSELHLVESVIYDGMKDAEHPWFYSTRSEYDTEDAEPISEVQAEEIMEKYVYKHPVFIPFTAQ